MARGVDLWKSRGRDSHTPTPFIDHKNGDNGTGLNVLGPGTCPRSTSLAVLGEGQV